MLPGIHGLDVCRIFKADQETKDIPIIMVTAMGQEEDIVKGLETGADDYITKPFSIKVLLARVSAVLRRSFEEYDQDSDKSLLINGISIKPRLREVRFEDKDFLEGNRQALYYARAIQEPTDTINGNALKCTYDKEGNCIEVNPCYGDYRIDEDNQCISKVEHRAWSSPIFVSKITNAK